MALHALVHAVGAEGGAQAAGYAAVRPLHHEAVDELEALGRDPGRLRDASLPFSHWHHLPIMLDEGVALRVLLEYRPAHLAAQAPHLLDAHGAQHLQYLVPPCVAHVDGPAFHISARRGHDVRRAARGLAVRAGPAAQGDQEGLLHGDHVSAADDGLRYMLGGGDAAPGDYRHFVAMPGLDQGAVHLAQGVPCVAAFNVPAVPVEQHVDGVGGAAGIEQSLLQAGAGPDADPDDGIRHLGPRCLEGLGPVLVPFYLQHPRSGRDLPQLCGVPDHGNDVPGGHVLAELVQVADRDDQHGVQRDGGLGESLPHLRGEVREPAQVEEERQRHIDEAGHGGEQLALRPELQVERVAPDDDVGGDVLPTVYAVAGGPVRSRTCPSTWHRSPARRTCRDNRRQAPGSCPSPTRSTWSGCVAGSRRRCRGRGTPG